MEEEQSNFSKEETKELVALNAVTKALKDPEVTKALDGAWDSAIGFITAGLFAVPFVSSVFSNKEELKATIEKYLMQMGDFSNKEEKTLGDLRFDKKQKVKITSSAKEVWPLVKKIAREENIDPALVMGIIYTESSFINNTVSSADAVGLMQIVPIAAKQVGLDLEDRTIPEKNIKAGCQLFNEIKDSHIPANFKIAARKGLKFPIEDLSEAELVRLTLYCYNRGTRGTIQEGTHGSGPMAQHNNIQSFFDALENGYKSKFGYDYTERTLNYASQWGMQNDFKSDSENKDNLDLSRKPGKVRVALIGDSITAFPGESNARLVETPYRQNFLGLAAASNQKIQIIANIGHIGQSPGYLRDTYLQTVIARGPDIVIIQGGGNQIRSSVESSQSVGAEEVTNIQKDVVQQLTNAGVKNIILCTLQANRGRARYLKRNFGSNKSNPFTEQEEEEAYNVAEEINDWIRSKGEGNLSWEVLDLDAVTSESGVLKSGLGEPDGLHLNMNGHAKIAGALDQIINNISSRENNIQESFFNRLVSL